MDFRGQSVLFSYVTKTFKIDDSYPFATRKAWHLSGAHPPATSILTVPLPSTRFLTNAECGRTCKYWQEHGF